MPLQHGYIINFDSIHLIVGSIWKLFHAIPGFAQLCLSLLRSVSQRLNLTNCISQPPDWADFSCIHPTEGTGNRLEDGRKGEARVFLLQPSCLRQHLWQLYVFCGSSSYLEASEKAQPIPEEWGVMSHFFEGAAPIYIIWNSSVWRIYLFSLIQFLIRSVWIHEYLFYTLLYSLIHYLSHCSNCFSFNH